MANLSSETLFHFTQNCDTLVSIINNGFYPRYCKEELFLKSHYFKGIYIPMLCFCDIPLSKANKHMDIYGKYALGMKRQWILNNKFSPVCYFTEKSIQSEILGKMFELLTEEARNDTRNGNITKTFLLLEDILSNLKPTEGKMQRTKNEKIKFYDEKEWRFYPLYPDYDFSILMKNTENAKIAELNEKLKSSVLKFSYSDIEYIIIEDDSKRKDIIAALKERFNTPEGIDYINSQKIIILTPDQINNDF
jgi:hypothetical protein